MLRLVTSVSVAACLAGSLTAQLSVVLPANAAGVEGSTSNNFPWGFTSNTISWGGLRIQAFYDTSNFTTQGVNGPILITGIRWRCNGNTAPGGGTFAQNTVALGASAVDYSAITTTYQPTNVVYNGPVNVIASAASTPGAWYVDVQLPTPFLYDPSLGNDLIIDTDRPIQNANNWSGVGSAANDISGAGSFASRIYASSNYPNANGTTQNHGIVVEIQYCEPGTWNQFGAGCPGLTAGIPDLVPVTGVPTISPTPTLGTTFGVAVSNAPSGVAIMIIGLNNTTSSLGPLPFDGNAVGAPGCFLRVSDDTTQLLPIGTPGWTLAIPNDPGFCDVSFFNQAIVLSPGTNTSNWIISNAYQMTIGL